MMHRHVTRYIALLSCVVLPCFQVSAKENDYKDFQSYVRQYEHINSLTIHAIYTREMTVSPYPNTFHNAKASGDYRYWYDNGLSRVDVDIKSGDANSAFLAQRFRYSHNGTLYFIHDLTHGIFESTKNVPLAANAVPLNPVLFPIAFLQGGMISELLQGIEHYQDADEVLSNITSHINRTDANGQSYLQIQLATDPAYAQDTPPTKSEYRVYMSKSLAAVNLPYRIESWANEVLTGVILMSSYSKVESGNRDLYLPENCSFIAYEGDEAILEYSVKVNEYLVQAIPKEQFTLEQPADAKMVITPERIMQTSDGSQRLIPDPPVRPLIDTLTPKTNTPKKYLFDFPTLIILFVILSVVGVVIYTLKR